jgi:hypothetical protein
MTVSVTNAFVVSSAAQLQAAGGAARATAELQPVQWCFSLYCGGSVRVASVSQQNLA